MRSISQTPMPFFSRPVRKTWVAATMVLATLFSSRATSNEADRADFRLRAMPWSELARMVAEGLATAGASPEALAHAAGFCREDTEGTRLADRLWSIARSAAEVDATAAAMVAAALDNTGESGSGRGAASIDLSALETGRLSPWMQTNLRLFWARHLAQTRRYDEAKELIDSLEPEATCDPAAVLFYQGVVGHHLLDRARATSAIGRLLDEVDDVPERFRRLGEQMLADLEQLEDDSLDEISRQMRDIERRLSLAEADQRLTDEETAVLAALDKMIDRLEQQQQQQQSASAAAGGRRGAPPTPGRPAEQSRLGQERGAGEVTPASLSRRGGWGDLPPRAREEALQQIGRDFPTHYRDAIEQYFRRLAGDSPTEASE